MYAGTIKYFQGSCFVIPTDSSRLFHILYLGEGFGVPAVAGNTSHPAYKRWDNKGDPPQPRGEEDCAGVCKKQIFRPKIFILH